MFPSFVVSHSPAATPPLRGTQGSIGYDICAAYGDQEVCVSIPPGNQALVSTGLVIAVPPGYYGRIAPRSGLALNHGIQVGGGVIDSDYRGEVKVILFNHHPTNTFTIKSGDRVAQLIFECASVFGCNGATCAEGKESDIACVCFVKSLAGTVAGTADATRGTGGFGSTGV